jgi:hypothetical protein
MTDISELYFVARTDIGGDTGQQRVFGAWDTEDEAAAQGALIAASQTGQFKVFKGAAVLSFTKPDAPVQAVPVT